MSHVDDFELDFDPADWIDYEAERLAAMAHEEVQRTTTVSLPVIVEEAVIERLVDSYDVEGDPEFDEDGYCHGGVSEFFRADPRQLIREERTAFMREIVARARRPISTPTVAHSRGPSRAPRRVVRVSRRRSTASRGSPSSDPHEPSDLDRRPLLAGRAA